MTPSLRFILIVYLLISLDELLFFLCKLYQRYGDEDQSEGNLKPFQTLFGICSLGHFR